MADDQSGDRQSKRRELPTGEDEADRIMRRLVRMPPKPHKDEKHPREKPGRRPTGQKDEAD